MWSQIKTKGAGVIKNKPACLRRWQVMATHVANKEKPLLQFDRVEVQTRSWLIFSFQFVKPLDKCPLLFYKTDSDANRRTSLLHLALYVLNLSVLDEQNWTLSPLRWRWANDETWLIIKHYNAVAVSDNAESRLREGLVKWLLLQFNNVLKELPVAQCGRSWKCMISARAETALHLWPKSL